MEQMDQNAQLSEEGEDYVEEEEIEVALEQ